MIKTFLGHRRDFKQEGGYLVPEWCYNFGFKVYKYKFRDGIKWSIFFKKIGVPDYHKVIDSTPVMTATDFLIKYNCVKWLVSNPYNYNKVRSMFGKGMINGEESIQELGELKYLIEKCEKIK